MDGEGGGCCARGAGSAELFFSRLGDVRAGAAAARGVNGLMDPAKSGSDMNADLASRSGWALAMGTTALGSNIAPKEVSP